MLLAELRGEIVSYARRLAADGLVVGTAGNISARSGDLVAATPSGLRYEELTTELVGVYRLDGSVVEAALAPTSELAMHLGVYRAAAGGAVVHAHPPAATAVSTLVDEVPSVHYYVAMFGGAVRVAPYATYGTQELAGNVVAALEGRTGCLIANHGSVTVGQNLRSAYDLTRQLEWLCEVYLRAAAAGRPAVLPSDEIERVRRALGAYGKRGPT